MEAKWSKNATSVVVLRHLYKTQIKWLIIYVKNELHKCSVSTAHFPISTAQKGYNCTLF